MRGGCDFGRRVPDEVELGLLLNRVALRVHFLLRRRFILALDLRFLFEGAFKRVAILEVPGAGALGLIVHEGALEIEAIGVDPLTGRELAILPVARHLHTRLLEQVGAIAALLAVLPPAGVDVTVLVGEDALAVAPSILPVAMVLANAVVEHLADVFLDVLIPAALVTMPSLRIPVNSRAETLTVDKVTLIDVPILVCRRAVPSEATRAGLSLVVLRDELILAFLSVLRHLLLFCL